MEFRLSHREKIIFEHMKNIFSFVFQTLLFLFLITLLLKEFYPGQVSAYINVNWFMIVVIIFGALSILFPVSSIENSEKRILINRIVHNLNNNLHEEKQPNIKDLILIIFLAILGTFIIFLKIKTLGWIGYVIAILGGLIIILLSWLILTEKENQETI